jgi:hypothetical protein
VTVDPQLFQAILDEMSEGASLRKACEKHGAHKSTFLRMVDGDKALQDQYAGARARMLDAQAEALEEIGDQAASAETAVEVAGLRLKSDNRKWLLSKLAPKKYGDKLDLNHGGGVEFTRVVRQVVDSRGSE